jgi:hypothetical protein
MITKPNKHLVFAQQKPRVGGSVPLGTRSHPLTIPDGTAEASAIQTATRGVRVAITMSKSVQTNVMCMLLISSEEVLLLLDQIKPIEQLVPVN